MSRKYLSPQEIMDEEMRRMDPNPDTLPDFAPLDWLQSLGREKKDQQEAQDYANKLKQYGTDTSNLEAMIAPANVSREPMISEGAPTKINPVVKEYLTKKLANRSPAVDQPLSSITKQSAQAQPQEDPLAKAEQEYNDRTSGFDWQTFGVGFGDALRGKGPENSIQFGKDKDARIYKETVGKAKDAQKQAKEDAIFKRQQDQFDPNSSASQSFRKIIEANFPNVAKAYGDNWNNVSAADQDSIFRPLQLKENIEARKEQARLMAEARQDAKADKDEIKRTSRMEDERSLEVPGFVRDSRYKPTKEEAVKAKSASATFNTLSSSLDRMDELVKENGSFEFGGRQGAEMETLNTTIQMNLKNLYDLGALSGPDMAIIQSQLNDPTSLKAMFSKNSSVRGGISSLKNQLQQSFMNNMASKGYAVRENSRQTQSNQSEQKTSKGPYGDTVVQGGVTYRYNPQTGQYE